MHWLPQRARLTEAHTNDDMTTWPQMTLPLGSDLPHDRSLARSLDLSNELARSHNRWLARLLASSIA